LISRSDAAAHGLAALFLITLLAVPGGPAVTGSLACLAAIVAGYRHWSREARASFRHMAPFAVPAAIFLLHIAIQVLTGMAPFRLSTHLLIGLLTLWVGLSAVPSRVPDVRRWLLPAAAVGALGSAGLALYQVFLLGYLRPYGWMGAAERANGAIKYGDLSALQALLSLVLLLTAEKRWQRLLGLAGLFSGVLSLGLTQTRGGIVGLAAAVVVLAAAIALRRPEVRASAAYPEGAAATPGAVPVAPGVPPLKARRRGWVGAVALALALTASAAGLMEQRFADIEPQVQRYLKGDVDSEMGQRLALWQAAGRAVARAPLTGSGFGRFKREIERQVASGEIPAGMPMYYGQTHNEYLAGLVDAGVTGFLAVTAMILAPILALFRQIRRGDDSPASYAALVIVTAFAFYALTDNIFDRQIMVTAYYFLVAWFMRAAFVPRPR
jgi:O-antigen ligase